MKKQPRQYFNILSEEGAKEATMFLYGYIGEEYSFDADTQRWKMTGVTDIEFVKEFKRLAAQYSTIHLRINSYGGEIMHGSAIVSAIQNSKVDVHTWCDGVAASMGAGIFLAGKKRHMAKNGMLMLHSAINLCWGNAKEMRECADVLDKFSQSIISGIAASTSLSEEAIQEKYFADYANHWLTYADALADGLITEKEEDYQAAEVPSNLAGMTYSQLVAYFEKENHPQAQQAQGFLQRLRAFFEESFGGQHSQPSQSDINDMNLKDFQDSLKAGTLQLEEVKAHLATLEQEPAPTAAAPESAELRKDLDAALAANANLAEQLKQLSATVAAWGKTPGASKSEPGMPDGDLPTADGQDTLEARLAKANAAYEAAAKNNEPASFVIGD